MLVIHEFVIDDLSKFVNKFDKNPLAAEAGLSPYSFFHHNPFKRSGPCALERPALTC